MEFVRSIRGYNHLWAVKYPEKNADELTLLFRNWSNFNYLLDFPYTENLDGLFHPLSLADNRAAELTREKARNWERERHASWLRVYAIRVEKDVFIVTGGAIKLTPTMQDRPHTQVELDKMNKCRDFLKTNGIFDQDSFIDYVNEEYDEK